MTKFHAVGTFQLDRGGKRTVIFGDVVEGVVKKGMKVAVPLNGSLSVTFEVEGIELLDNRSEKIGYVGLVMKSECEDGEDDDVLQMLAVEDVILEVSDP